VTVAVGLGWRAGLLLAASAAFVVMAPTARTAVPAGPQSVPVRPRLRPHPDGDGAALPTPFWPALAVLVLCIGAEFALTFWASDLLRERVGASAAVATACIAALVLGMTVRRAAGPPGGRLALAHRVDTLLGASLTVATLVPVLLAAAAGFRKLGRIA